MKFRSWLAVAFVLALPCAWFAAGKMHRFAYWIGRKSEAQVAALASGGWKVDRLEVEPGVQLVGLVRVPRRSDAPWLLFVPGNSEALLDGFRDVLDGLCGDADVGMAFWAYRGFDASDGVPSPAALQRDLDAEWARMVALGATPARTEIWGYSLGSTLAPHLAATLCRAGTPPKRLVLLATGPAIRIRPFGRFGRFRPSDVYAAGDAFDAITCPVAIGQGANDDALPVDGARAVAQRFGERATLHVFAGRGHADLWPDVRRELWRP